MRKCVTKAMLSEEGCQEKNCRYWIDYECDKNCTFVAICKKKEHTYQEIGDKLGLSRVRIKQIESKALEKLKSHCELDVLES